jgi:hypothetical protein
MCLLIIKPSNVEYDHDFIVWSINNGMSFNRDGVGGAVRKQLTNTLMMNKGFFNNNIQYFINWLKDCKIAPEDELMIHLRQGTAGSVNMYNSHPYILGEDSVPASASLANISYLTVDSDSIDTGVFAHNGIFSYNSYVEDDHTLSDTYNWGMTHFGNLTSIEKLKKEGLDYLNSTSELEKSLAYQKVCFMFPDRELIRKGNFISDRGVLFSNQGYKNGNYNDRGGVQVNNDSIANNYEKLWNILLFEQEKLLKLPPSKTDSVTVENNTEINTEIKKTVNTNFDFSIEIVPNSDVKIINFKPVSNKKPNFNIINISNQNTPDTIDICINITKENKDHFLLRSKRDTIKYNKLLPKDEICYIYNVYDSINSSTGRNHAISVKAVNFSNENTYIVKTNDISSDFQVMPKSKYFDIYKDYMKLVNLYGIDISKNKKKKLRQLYISVMNTNMECTLTKCFYKARYNCKSLALFYENFYKEDTPVISSRSTNNRFELTT